VARFGSLSSEWFRRSEGLAAVCWVALSGCGAEGARGLDAGPSAGAVADAAPGGQPPESGTCHPCDHYAAPRTLGSLPAPLTEMSGLAASVRHPGIYYAHNDSANTPRFFAVDEAARIVAVIELAGAPAKDWEAIAVGPCASGTCVYVADIGDNDLERDDYALLRLPEPATLPADGSTISLGFEAFALVYPDGRHNAEALLVHPASGQLFIVTKADAANVYELQMPLTSGRPVTLAALGALPLPTSAGMVTDGAFHPCGARLLLRTKDAAYELVGSPGAGPASLFGATPVSVPLAVEPQGEGSTYTINGRSYLTGGEIGGGQTPPSLSVVDCAARPDPPPG
jgi:hypothetical protein